MEISVGVSALLSGVVPRNRIMLIGFLPVSHALLVNPALFANRDVFPHPPSPYNTKGLSLSPNMYSLILSNVSSRP